MRNMPNRAVVEVPGLNGLDGFGHLGSWYRQLAGSVAAQCEPRSGINPKVVRAAIQNKVSATLKLPAIAAKDVMHVATLPQKAVTPNSVLTPDGAQDIAVAGRKAQAAAALAHGRANKLEIEAKKMTAHARRLPHSHPQRAAAERKATELMKETLRQRIESQRAVVVGGAALAALKFRQKAQAAKTPEERNDLIQKAMSAVTAGQVMARTAMKVVLPADPVSAAIPMTSARIPPGLAPTLPENVVTRPAGIMAAALPNPAGQLRPAQLPDNMDRAVLLSYEANNTVVATFQGLDGLGDFDFGAAFKAVTDVAKSIVPAHTIVGKALNGDYGGAIVDGTKFTANVIQAGSGKPPPMPPAQQQVMDEINNSSGSIKPPGMSNPLSNIPGWVIPAGLAGVAAVAAIILL